MLREQSSPQREQSRPTAQKSARRLSATEELIDRLGNRGALRALGAAASVPVRRQCSGGGDCACAQCGTRQSANDGTRISVGRADDPAEREADRIASEVSADGLPAGVATSSAGVSNAPLDPTTRAFAESRLGADFSDVRVHADGAAAASAREVNARAYTVGRDIVFGANNYTPGTEAGRRLVLHELVHTIQDPTNGLVRRQEGPDAGAPDATVPDTSPTDAGAHDAESVSGGVTTPPSPAPAAPEAPAFDPCAVVVASLTNAELLANFARADAYVREPDHYRRDQFYDYLTLRRRTGSERERRAHAGECWLADDVTGVPATLYRLEPGPNGMVAIGSETSAAAAGAPRTYTDVSVLTDRQLRNYLADNHVGGGALDDVLRAPQELHLVDIRTANIEWAIQHPPEPQNPLFMPFGGGLGGMQGTLPFGRTPNYLTSELFRGFGVGADMNYNSMIKYQGAIGEYGYLGSDPARSGFIDLNVAAGGNAPGYDFLDPVARAPIQNKQSTSEPLASPTRPNSTYASGIESIWGYPGSQAKNTAWRATLQSYRSQYGVDLGPWVAMNNAQMAITAEHVPAVQGVVRQMVSTDPVYYAEQYRAFISRNPVTHQGAPYNVLDFNRDLRAGAVPADVRQAVGEIASRAIVESVGLDPTSSLVSLMQGNMGEGMSARDAALALRPMQMQGAIEGYNPYVRAGAQGAGGNLVGGVTLSLLQRARAAMAGRPYGGTVVGDLQNIAITTPFAAGTSALEARLTDSALQASMRGLPVPWYLSGGARGAGLPAITAPIMTEASLALSGHSYPWQEHVVQDTRATVNALGAAGFIAFVGSFATAGAEGGAVGGTVLEPGGGTAVGGGLGWVGGAIVGTIGYFLTDLTVGDTVEAVTRSLVGEPDGCR